MEYSHNFLHTDALHASMFLFVFELLKQYNYCKLNKLQEFYIDNWSTLYASELQ
jgi:hypothetical protein